MNKFIYYHIKDDGSMTKLPHERRGRVSNKSIFRQMRESSNAVTRCVLREILVSRFERGEHV